MSTVHVFVFRNEAGDVDEEGDWRFGYHDPLSCLVPISGLKKVTLRLRICLPDDWLDGIVS